MSDSHDSDDVVDFAVRRDDWKQTRVTRSPRPANLAPGQVCFRVDRFAFTSNNVTYALIGDMLGYWKFFPAEAPWGRIPVMGFADVIGSENPDVSPGERVFGFFPMATHLVVDADTGPGKLIVDAAPHRQDTAVTYRQYTRVTGDPLYEMAREDQHMLLRGLFITSFLVDDYLADSGAFGARSFVISSASSKTAIALAYLLSGRSPGHVVGLTSARNRAFVEGLGCYDRVLTYDAIAELPTDVPVAFVDHSGDAEVVAALHHHLKDNVKYSGIVGATHWDRGGRTRDLPGSPPAFFFAPSQLEKRIAEWGSAGFQERLGGAWRRFVAFSDGWLRVVRGAGPAAVESTYREVLEGRALPNEGHVLSLRGTSA